METLDIKGVRVETHIAGSGPPLLYLHAEQYFEQVRPHLDALAKNWRVIAPRHPGYGAASGATDLRSVDDLAYLYLDLLDELKLDNVVLVGASLGGWIALEMCVRSHARLSKLVLVSSVGVKFSGREERDFADLFYMPDIEAFPMLFADLAAPCAELRSDVLRPAGGTRARAPHARPLWLATIPAQSGPEALAASGRSADTGALGRGGQVCHAVLRPIARRGAPRRRADGHSRGGTLSRDRAVRSCRSAPSTPSCK